MLTSIAVELNNTFLLVTFSKRSTNSQDISIWIPFAALDEHSSVDKERFSVTQLSHELKSSALIGNAEACSIFRRILIRETLLVVIIPLNSSKWHLCSLDASEALNLN